MHIVVITTESAKDIIYNVMSVVYGANNIIIIKADGHIKRYCVEGVIAINIFM